MFVLGVILVLLSPLLLIVGLIVPRLFSTKGAEKPGRLRGVGISVAALVIGLILIGIGEPPEDADDGERAARKEEPAVKDTVPVKVSPETKTTFNDNAGGQAASNVVEKKPVAQVMTLSEYETKCLEVSETAWRSMCAGTNLEADLFVMDIGKDGRHLFRSNPVNGEGSKFNVTFAAEPAWGADNEAWTNRKAHIAGTLSQSPPTFLGVAFIENARVVDWLDLSESDGAKQADAVALDANRSMDAPWRSKAVAMLKAKADVIDAAWADQVDLRISMPPMPTEGETRDAEAKTFCSILTEAGKMDGNRVVITVIDVRSVNSSQLVQIGSAGCP